MRKPILFFDGSCPLCRREIHHYRQLDKNRAINWLDIANKPAELAEHNLSSSQAMRFIHGVDAEGTLVRGLEAFMMVWRELPYYRRLATVIEILRLQPLLNLAYERFANWRFKRRCPDDQCSI